MNEGKALFRICLGMCGLSAMLISNVELYPLGFVFDCITLVIVITAEDIPG